MPVLPGFSRGLVILKSKPCLDNRGLKSRRRKPVLPGFSRGLVILELKPCVDNRGLKSRRRKLVLPGFSRGLVIPELKPCLDNRGLKSRRRKPVLPGFSRGLVILESKPCLDNHGLKSRRRKRGIIKKAGYPSLDTPLGFLFLMTAKSSRLKIQSNKTYLALGQVLFSAHPPQEGAGEDPILSAFAWALYSLLLP